VLVREAFVHQARLELGPDGDERAPGAAVTVALCGHWEHEPPCRVPHRTDVVRREGREVVVRVLFACPPADADAVRVDVRAAVEAGALTVPAPDGAPARRWRVLSQGPAQLEETDRPVAVRFIAMSE
jgi:hypothetical protein